MISGDTILQCIHSIDPSLHLIVANLVPDTGYADLPLG